MGILHVETLVRCKVQRVLSFHPIVNRARFVSALQIVSFYTDNHTCNALT